MTVDIIRNRNGDRCKVSGKGCANEGTKECNTCSIYAGVGPGRTNKYKQE